MDMRVAHDRSVGQATMMMNDVYLVCMFRELERIKEQKEKEKAKQLKEKQRVAKKEKRTGR